MATITAPEIPPEIAELYGHRWHHDMLSLDQLFVDPSYQRKLKQKMLREIVREFNPILAGILTVSARRSNKFALIDGQTRHSGMQQIGLTDWFCVVVEGLKPADEADLFWRIQEKRQNVTSSETFKSKVKAGDKIAVTIAKILEHNGLIIDPYADRPEVIRAPAAVRFVYHGARGGNAESTLTRAFPQLLDTQCQIVKGAWPTLPDNAKSALFWRGMGQFLYDHLTEKGVDGPLRVDTDRAIRLFGRHDPSELNDLAQSRKRSKRKMSSSSPQWLAEILAEVYWDRRG